MWGKPVLFLVISFLTSGFSSGQSIQDYTEILEEGRKAAENERYEQALQIWGRAAEDPSSAITDPRIGVAYIELATRQKLKSYYEDAVRMYLWGFSGIEYREIEDALDDELKRLQPITDHRTYRTWRRMLQREQLREVADEITRFWERNDPTINTRYNERLVEHWLRIDYSRANFTRGRSSIYETDDRALIYVKYGEPDKIRDGIFSYNSGMVRNWLQDALDMRAIQIPAYSSGSDSVSRARFSQQVRMAIAQNSMLLNEYERQVRFQHRYPSYEIWVYENIETSSFHNLIYIFGTDGNTGEFGMRNSVEEMMPSGAFRSQQTGMRISPSLFLQLLFYESLITVDNFFAETFNKMESSVYGLGEVGQWESRQFRSQNASRLRQAQLTAPDQRTSLDKSMPSVSVDVYQYRLLNERNEPYLATFILSNPYRAYLFDQISENDRIQAYRLYGTGVGYTGSDSLVFKQKTDPLRLRNLEGFFGNVDRITPELLYLPVPHAEDMDEQHFTVELQSLSKDSTQISDALFKQHVRAFGTSRVEDVEPPLSADENQLQMGDLIVGIRSNTPREELPFGFMVRPDAIFEEGEDMVVHLEAYSLSGSENQLEPFQIQYIVKEKAGFLKRLFTKQEKVRLSLNFESTAPQFRENLEIDTSPFESGKYVLELTVTEPATQRSVTQSVDFRINKQPDQDQN